MASLTQLEYAIAVDKWKHFGKAAEACFVTQPTLSMQLQKLEEELEVILFDRSKKPIVTTTAGEKYIEQAKKVIHELRVFQELKESDELSGEIKLAVIPTLAPYITPIFLKSFHQNMPKVKLRVVELTTPQMLKALESEEIDAGLLVTPLNLKNMVEELLFYEEFFLYCHPESSLAKKTSIKSSDLETEGLWLLQEGHCFRDQILNVCSNRKVSNQFENVSFESGSFETLKNLVDKNGGFTFFPRLAARNLLGPSFVKKVKSFAKPVPVRQVSLVYARQHYKRKILDGLLACIKSSLPNSLLVEVDKRVSIIDI
jgi:LysR family hydrogen peroxide-inducible transcriptional activator